MSFVVLDPTPRPAVAALPTSAFEELVRFLPSIDTTVVNRVAGPVELGDAVAAVARLFDLTPPTSTGFVGTLDEKGSLGDVDPPRALPEVSRLVAPPDAQTALRTLRGDASTPHLVIAPTFAKVVELALPAYRELDRHALEVDASALLDVGLRGPRPSFFGWTFVQRLAIAHLRGLDDSDPNRWLVELVRDAAARHEGHDALCAWPTRDAIRSLERGLRLEVLAHVVQSAADADWDAAHDYARRAAEWVASPGERHASDAKLLGAMGRAYAAAGSFPEAARSLTASLETFEALRQPAMATYSVSELLRVTTDLDPNRALLLATEVAPRIADAADPIGRAFVQLARGRAFASLDEPQRALEALAENAAAWDRAPLHARQARWRWSLVAARALSLPEVEAWTQRLTDLGPFEHLYLAELDAALVSGAPALPALEALLGLPVRGREAHRLLHRIAPVWTVENVAADDMKLFAFSRSWRY